MRAARPRTRTSTSNMRTQRSDARAGQCARGLQTDARVAARDDGHLPRQVDPAKNIAGAASGAETRVNFALVGFSYGGC